MTANGNVAPFAPVLLEFSERHAYQTMVEWLVQRQVRQFERFQLCIHPFHEETAWKCVESRANMSVYYAQTRRGSSGCSTVMPKFIGSGRIQGTVEDALYGLMTPTTMALKRRNDLFPDRLVDGAVLAMIFGPEHDTPLTCTTINWSVKALVKPLSLMTHKHRDFVYLDATGFTTTCTGERIGFHLKHSINWHHRHTLLVNSSMRSKLSMCTIFRQVSTNCVQVFAEAHVDPMEKWTGTMCKPWVIRAVAESLMAYSQATVCGQVRQLACFLGCHGQSTLGDDTGSRLTRGHCWNCGTEASCLHPNHECGLCAEVFCLRCSFQRPCGVFRSRQRRFDLHNQCFCARCMHKIDRVTAVGMAQEELKLSVMMHSLYKPHHQPETSITILSISD